MYEPTLTPRTDYAPVPRVEFVFTAVDPACERATVYRVGGGRTHRVRGAIDVFAAGGFAGVDAEAAPWGEEITYRAEMFDAAGMSLGFTGGATVTLNAEGACIHQPLDPSRGVSVRMRWGAAGELSRPHDGELVQPVGRELPIWVGFGRTGYRDVDLGCFTETPEDGAAMRSVFGEHGDQQLPIVCFRTSLPMGIPQPFFAVVRDPRPTALDAHVGGSLVRWAMVGDEVAAPAAALSTGVLTYADMEATYATYAAAEAAYLTYLDAESDFTLAGVAG